MLSGVGETGNMPEDAGRKTHPPLYKTVIPNRLEPRLLAARRREEPVVARGTAGAEEAGSTRLEAVRNDRVDQWGRYPSFFPNNSFTNFGLACPLESSITLPTKKPITVFFPARYCSTCLGFPASTSSIIFSSADVSRDC